MINIIKKLILTHERRAEHPRVVEIHSTQDTKKGHTRKRHRLQNKHDVANTVLKINLQQ